MPGGSPPRSSLRHALLGWCGSAAPVSRMDVRAQRPAVRPSPRPQRVLDPRRGVPYRTAGGPGGRAGDARDRPHRPRIDGGRGRAHPGRDPGRRQARCWAARCTSSTITPPGRTEGAPLPPDAAGRDHRGLPQPRSGWSRAAILDGYWYKPRVDLEQLAAHAEGIIALSGCLSGRVCKALVDGDAAGARERARPARADLRPRRRLRRDPGRRHRRADADPARRWWRWRATPACRMVGTGDVHYLTRDDAMPHEALLCIQTQDTLDNPDRFRFSNHEFYLKRPQEMYALMGERFGRGHAAPHGRDRRALQRRGRPRRHAPAPLRRARGPDRLGLPARAGRDGPARALPQRDAGAARAARVRAEDDRGDGLPRLLPDRLGLHPLRPRGRRLGRPGPRLGGGLAGRLLPAHHRPRSDAPTRCCSSGS